MNSKLIDAWDAALDEYIGQLHTYLSTLDWPPQMELLLLRNPTWISIYFSGASDRDMTVYATQIGGMEVLYVLDHKRTNSRLNYVPLNHPDVFAAVAAVIHQALADQLARTTAGG